jgi:hypothetical protein
MAELDGMTDDQLTSQIKEMEANIRREKNDFTNLNK